MRKNIAIIDDHEIVRVGLRRVLLEDPSMTIIFEVEHPSLIPDHGENKVDVVILDLSFRAGLYDLASIGVVKERLPHTKIIIFSMVNEEAFGLEAIKCGARGFVSKESDAESIIDAINRVLDGGVYLSNKLSHQMADLLVAPQKNKLDQLSKREKEVLIYLGSGETIKEIGYKLSLSIKTVSTHKQRIMSKLKISNIAELVYFCLDHNLVDKFQIKTR